MSERRAGRAAFVLAGLHLACAGWAAPAAAEPLGSRAHRQIRAIYAEKARLTPAERKLDTSLLNAARETRGEAMVQGLAPRRRVAARAGLGRDRTVFVEVRARVTDTLLSAIRDLGGLVMGSHRERGSVRARLPIARVEAVAALPEVRFIRPRQPFVVNAGALTSEGDTAHAAAATRSTHGFDGAGVKVGVLSNGADGLAGRQATGDLPPTCATPPGTEACVRIVTPECAVPPCGSEGTAMMEVVHDLAPGAQLYFAGTTPGSATEADYAESILALRNTYGCDVIVDDLTFVEEAAFQDGPIARAVNSVKASGALFFSSAGSTGRKTAGTSGTWEGDFVPSGTAIDPLCDWDPGCWQTWQGLPLHSFSGLTGAAAVNSNALTADALFISLKWSDPLGQAANDYDLFILDSTLSEVFDWSANDQGVLLDPVELIQPGFSGERLVVVLFGHVPVPGQPAVRGGGSARALRLDTHGAKLSLGTARSIAGHNGGEGTISVAATDARIAAGGPFVGGTANPIEVYSSDGPRRIFYHPDGTAVTPGRVTFGSGGGLELRKPDLTAADCVQTTTPGLSPFCGTSAAAAHAAAIAALLKSAPNARSAGQVLAAMFQTALDVDPAGWDRDSGMGIVMAHAAAAALASVPPLGFYTVAPCRAVDTRQAGGPTAGAPLTCGMDTPFAVGGGSCGVPPEARAVSVNVTVTQPSGTGTLRVFASGAPTPTSSSLNYAAGQTRANNAVAALGADGRMAVRCSPSGTAHVIVDVNGYFR